MNLKNWFFAIAVFGTVFAYTGIANSLELSRQPAAFTDDESAAEEKGNEETKAEEQVRETEGKTLSL